MRVIGYRKVDFDGTDGKHVTGMSIFCTYPLADGKGTGEACERLFITLDRLVECGYTPEVDDEIEVSYNRYGKPAAITAM